VAEDDAFEAKAKDKQDAGLCPAPHSRISSFKILLFKKNRFAKETSNAWVRGKALHPVYP
jgi:hypothetical protein